MITINGLAENYDICPHSPLNQGMWLEIIDKNNEVVIKGQPLNFTYFLNETGKYEFKVVFSNFIVENIESEKGEIKYDKK